MSSADELDFQNYKIFVVTTEFNIDNQNEFRNIINLDGQNEEDLGSEAFQAKFNVNKLGTGFAKFSSNFSNYLEAINAKSQLLPVRWSETLLDSWLPIDKNGDIVSFNVYPKMIYPSIKVDDLNGVKSKYVQNERDIKDKSILNGFIFNLPVVTTFGEISTINHRIIASRLNHLIWFNKLLNTHVVIKELRYRNYVDIDKTLIASKTSSVAIPFELLTDDTDALLLDDEDVLEVNPMNIKTKFYRGSVTDITHHTIVEIVISRKIIEFVKFINDIPFLITMKFELPLSISEELTEFVPYCIVTGNVVPSIMSLIKKTEVRHQALRMLIEKGTISVTMTNHFDKSSQEDNDETYVNRVISYNLPPDTNGEIKQGEIKVLDSTSFFEMIRETQEKELNDNRTSFDSAGDVFDFLDKDSFDDIYPNISIHDTVDSGVVSDPTGNFTPPLVPSLNTQTPLQNIIGATNTKGLGVFSMNEEEDMREDDHEAFSYNYANDFLDPDADFDVNNLL